MGAWLDRLDDQHHRLGRGKPVFRSVSEQVKFGRNVKAAPRLPNQGSRVVSRES